MEFDEGFKAIIKKYYPECLRGEHVPVATMDEDSNIVEVFCQNCCKPMTIKDHKAYFGDQ